MRSEKQGYDTILSFAKADETLCRLMAHKIAVLAIKNKIIKRYKR